MTTFSVITVVYNDCAGVVRTMQSIFDQTCPDYEVIVQDGASSDGTSEVLRGFGDWIDDLTIEADDGIYDAMNRALGRASGEWLLFLNASDYFVDNMVLERIAGELRTDDDIVIGRAMSDETGKLHQYRRPDRFWTGSTNDHQASFIRREIMQELRYSTAYPIAGDLDFFTRARLANYRQRHIETVVARKPFSVGASVGFIDRFRDRLPILEGAFEGTYPVRETLRRELRDFMAGSFDLPAEHLDRLSLPELVETCERWEATLK